MSRNGVSYKCYSVENSQEIKELCDSITKQISIVAIDEVQFFDKDIINVVEYLNNKGIRVLIAGIETDFRGEGFGCLPYLICYCDSLVKLTAICSKCGSEYACRNQRVQKGSPIKDGDVIQCDDGSNYEPRCIKCFQKN